MSGEIELIRIGEVKEAYILKLKSDLEEIFKRKVVEGPQMEEPRYAFDPSRGQYLGRLILQRISARRSPSEKKLGITSVDLYAPGLNFIFGEADPLNGVAVISICRLRQEFYGLPPDEKLLGERILKEAVHELGHTWGLGHCSDSRCVMFFSNSLLDTDRKSARFCSKCEEKLAKAMRR